jgi:exopolysaccharide production protein ExoQ
MTTNNQPLVRRRGMKVGGRIPNEVIHEWLILTYLFLMPLITFDAVPLPTIAIVGVSGIGVLVLLTSARGTFARMRVSMAAIAFVGWCLLSAAWVYDSSLFVNKSERFLIPAFIFLAIGASAPAEVIVRGFLRGYYVLLGYIVFTLVTDPLARLQIATATEGALPGWHGPFGHKNVMSTLLVVGMVFVLAFETRRRVRWGAFGIIAVLLIGSRSGTGLAGVIFVITAWNWLRTFVKQERRMTAPFVFFSVAGLLVSMVVGLTTLPIILAAYGKDTTFTGRTNIWSGVLWAIERRPLLGYGYSGVWISENVEPTFSMMRRIGFRAFHAHNGALDVVLQVGIIGLVLFVCLFVPTLLSSLRLARRGSSVGSLVVVAGLAIAVMSLSESLFLGPWIPFVCLCRGMTLREERPPRPRARRNSGAVRSPETPNAVSPKSVSLKEGAHA